MQVGRLRYSKAELKTIDTFRDTSGALALASAEGRRHLPCSGKGWQLP